MWIRQLKTKTHLKWTQMYLLPSSRSRQHRLGLNSWTIQKRLKVKRPQDHKYLLKSQNKTTNTENKVDTSWSMIPWISLLILHLRNNFNAFPTQLGRCQSLGIRLKKELLLLLRTELLCDTEEEAKHISFSSVSPIGVTAQNLWVKISEFETQKIHWSVMIFA
jgi:hypothetical protein